MAEVASQPAPRGRGSTRSRRGGHNPRGGGRSGSRQTNGHAESTGPNVSLDDQGELGLLKKKYMSDLSTLKELFPDWTDDDLVFALQETDGDLQSTIERITEGNVSRFADVKKKTREKIRPKQAEVSSTESDTKAPAGRGRGRGGSEAGRGGRGRGSERGRGGARGGRGGASASFNGSRASATAVTSTPSGAWDSSASGGWDSATANNDSGWDQSSKVTGLAESNDNDATITTSSEGQKSSLIPQGTTKSWASMLAQTKPAPAIPKNASAAQPTSDVEPSKESEAQANQGLVPQDNTWSENAAQELQPNNSFPASDQPQSKPADRAFTDSHAAAFDTNIMPPTDRLTENNLENLPDASVPATTDTVASTRDPSSAIGSVTPSFSSKQQPPIARPPVGGYATSAWRATGAPGRSASFQRKMMDQREAVVMPGNHAVDRAAVQFGSLGLNGTEGTNALDVDDDREDAETRTQPPQQSPSAPRASLPPAPRQHGIVADVPSAQGQFPIAKQASEYPDMGQQSISANGPPQASSAQSPSQNFGAPGQPGHNQVYNHYGAFGGRGIAHDHGAPAQKPYDPFSQQLGYSQNQNEQQSMHSGQPQPTSNLSQHAQGVQGGLSQTPSDPALGYASDTPRNVYQGYYGNTFRPQTGSSMAENVPPQRSTSGLGTAEPPYGSSQPNQAQSRFGEGQVSGHNTPNPPPGTQSQQSQHLQQQQQHGPTSQGGSYPYQNPYYGSGSYYNTYMSQYPNQFNHYGAHQGFGGHFGAKGGMYGQPHQGFGMSPQTAYDHSSSPANTGAFGPSSFQGRESSLSGFNDYTRSTSTQPSQPQQSGASSAFGGVSENFGRSSSSFGTHGQGYSTNTTGTAEESLKAFQETKTNPGQGIGQPGRPASGFNSAAHQANQSGYGPPQQSFGAGYPNHLNQLHNTQGSQYGGLGGLGGQHGSGQSHHGGGYGGAYGSGFGNTYSNYGGRGGWGGNYPH